MRENFIATLAQEKRWSSTIEFANGRPLVLPSHAVGESHSENVADVSTPLFRHFITMVCVVASLIAHAGEQSPAGAEGAANQPVAGELQRLQGTWEGVLVG